MEQQKITRRQMVQRMAMAIGGTLVALNVLLESCSFDPDTTNAGPARLAMLDAIAETIIPRTATAGARDAQDWRVYRRDDPRLLLPGYAREIKRRYSTRLL